jgi:hypothetical protein
MTASIHEVLAMTLGALMPSHPADALAVADASTMLIREGTRK